MRNDPPGQSAACLGARTYILRFSIARDDPGVETIACGSSVHDGGEAINSNLPGLPIAGIDNGVRAILDDNTIRASVAIAVQCRGGRGIAEPIRLVLIGRKHHVRDVGGVHDAVRHVLRRAPKLGAQVRVKSHCLSGGLPTPI